MFRLSFNSFRFQLTRTCSSTQLKSLEGTLHMRFFEHLKQNKQITDQKLAMMLRIFREDYLNPQTDVYNERFKEIDKLCVRNIRTFKAEKTFGLLDELIYTMPERILFLRSFPEAVKILIRHFEEKPNKKDFVKLCFYIGLFKTKSPGPTLLTGFTERYLDKLIDDMSTIDFAIICTASYKASVRIESMKFRKRLEDEIISMTTIDDHIFIAFIKSLRLNKINSSTVINKLRKLRESGEFNKTNLILTLLHVLPLLADNFIKDDQLIEYFVEKCVANEDFDDSLRIKDIGNLLYACALLNFPIKLDHFKKIEKIVLKKAEENEFQQWFDDFVDIGLSMWILNFRSRPFIRKLLDDKKFLSYGNQKRIKLDSRKKLLLTCIEIEEPFWIRDIVIETPSFDEQRSAPKYLIKPTLEEALNRLPDRNAVFVQQIKHLNIAGILVKDNHHLEVLDKTNSLSDGLSPNGIFALKLRLLKELGCEVEIVG